MMDGVGIQLPAAVPDSFYDISSHGAGYQPYPVNNSSWIERDDTRAFQPQGSEFEPHIRHGGILPRRPGYHDRSIEGQDVVNPEWNENEEKDLESCHGNGVQKQSQVAETLSWLSDNYERAEGVCLPRCVLYQHYQEFCKKLKFTPAGAATFGKIIRQRFPKLTTRRLGTRGQSKYHYYGIGIKETSIYYHSVYSGKGLTRFSGMKIRTEGSNRKYSLSSKTGTLLPDFPNADNLILPENIEREKMRTFIMMYRTHCQRILDTVISANFDEVQIFLVHFWQGMPDHLVDVLRSDLVTDIVGLCDSILYKVLIDVLIPPSIQDLPDTLYSEIRMFSKRLPFWLESALEDIQEDIKAIKLEVAKNFVHSLKRQSSFVQLAQTSRAVLANQDIMSQMTRDLADVDFVEICTHAGFMEPSADSKFSSKLYEFFDEFQSLLGRQATIEAYTEWLDNIIDTCILQPSGDDIDMFKVKAAGFLLQWGAFGALLMRDLTLRSSTSFGALHLLRTTLDEYVFLVVETRQDQETEKTLQTRLQKHMENAEEIQTQAKLRNSVNKSHSPKGRKRRHGEEYDSDSNVPSSRDNKSTDDPGDCSSVTAFSRPPPTRDIGSTHTLDIPADPSSRVPSQGALAIPPLKPYQTYSSSNYDRPTYLPQFGIGPHSDYVGNGSVFGAGRFPNYSESYSQPFSSNPFSSNISPVNGSYWSDGRGHHSLTDTYQPYGYNKLSASYDNWNKSSIFRSNGYQDGLSRPAFDTRAYYRSSHDNLQVGTPLPVATYSGNFMDIAPSASPYCRQDGGLFYQEDIYPVSMATPFGKPYLPGAFR